MKQEGICLWISSSRRLFPCSIKDLFGPEPDKIIFIDLQREKKMFYGPVEEALKCKGIAGCNS
jgi:protein ImuA